MVVGPTSRIHRPVCFKCSVVRYSSPTAKGPCHPVLVARRLVVLTTIHRRSLGDVRKSRHRHRLIRTLFAAVTKRSYTGYLLFFTIIIIITAQ